MSIEVGDSVTVNVYPHNGRSGEVLLAVEYAGEWHYNVWMHDNGDRFGFDEGEIVLTSEYQGD